MPDRSANRGRKSFHSILSGAALAAAGAMILPGMASGATLLLDFGNGDTYAGVNSPAHVEGTVPLAYTDWRQVPSTAGDGGSVVVQDSASNNVTVHMGRNPSAGDEADLNRPVYDVSGAGTGIFNTDLTNDALISYDSDSTFRDPIASLITGLPNGEYFVYIVGHYAGNAASGFNVLAGPSALAGPDGENSNKEIGDVYDLGFAQALTGGNSTEWVEGVNYAKFTITLDAANPNLIVATDQAQGTSSNSHLAAVMVTPVPEPGTLGLLAGAGLPALRRRSRRH